MIARLRHAPTDTDRLTCPRCAAAYHPALTRGDCPVCGAVGDTSHHATAAGDEDRPIALAVAAMACNLLVFGLVVWAVLG